VKTGETGRHPAGSHIQRSENREQQDFRDGQVAKGPVQTEVGNPELQHAGNQNTQLLSGSHAPPTGERQKDQGTEQHTAEHRKIAVHLAGQKFADQTE